ncbi:MAG: D-amino acid aminotransferase [Longimicrobiales bacterium]|nr:D-amino acid aminotransferase [Longimicrobiales bacterium]
MSTGTTVFLNGAYLPMEEATVSVNDRGFLFSDGVYEVTPAYRGRLFLFDRHRDRLRRGLGELRIEADIEGLGVVHGELLERNGLRDEPVSIVYLQITRGVAPRTHAFPPEPVAPTVYAFARPFQRPAPERWRRGFTAVTVPDRRWARVDVKTVSLLGNVLAQQAAVDAGVDDAILVRDGVALEGAHSNLFAVFGGTLVTHPRSNLILPGITRGFVLELARELGVPVEERPVQVEELAGADELFFTGTTTEVKPCVAVDGRTVGDGDPGPVTERLSEAFRARVG